MARFTSINSLVLLQGLALLVALAGVATWTVLLSSSTAAPSQLSTQTVEEQAPQTAGAVQWFASAAANMDIKLTGLLATQRGAVAILSIDDQPARAFLAGERLGEGVHLRAIEGDAVVIERSGAESRLSMARLPDAPAMPQLR